ncbi:MAG TPA: hypothetical protein VMU50_11805 [Polyangia bacterium]|nr:hypothetical protein [Polyangia bacterium]
MPSDAVTAQLIAAVDHALGGDWQRAHEIVQAHEDEPIANWIHGTVHWIEGDLSNAGYWFGRAGRHMSDHATPDAALRAIRAALPRSG